MTGPGQSHPSRRELGSSVTRTLERSAVVEQAKGVVMQVRDVDAGTAFRVLFDEARQRALPVTVVAERLLAGVARGESADWLRGGRVR